MKAIQERTYSETLKSLVDAFPSGELFKATRIEGSNIRTFLEGFVNELLLIEKKINELYSNYFLSEDRDVLLEEWETELGIPDDCFTIENKTRAERVQQVLAKKKMSSIVTEQDYIEIASIFGINITIEQGVDKGIFPMTLPILLGTPKQLRFTMIVNMPSSLSPTSVFPLTLPFTLSSSGGSIVECLFNKLKPANVVIVYNYIL